MINNPLKYLKLQKKDLKEFQVSISFISHLAKFSGDLMSMLTALLTEVSLQKKKS